MIISNTSNSSTSLPFTTCSSVPENKIVTYNTCFYVSSSQTQHTVMRRITTDRMYDGGLNYSRIVIHYNNVKVSGESASADEKAAEEFLVSLDKLIVEENYLPEHAFNMNETSLFWKRIPERTSIHKEAKSRPGLKVCVSTLYDVRTITKSSNDAFLRTYPHH